MRDGYHFAQGGWEMADSQQHGVGIDRQNIRSYNWCVDEIDILEMVSG
jgi:hypothetical protein